VFFFALVIAVSSDHGVALVYILDGGDVGGNVFKVGEGNEIGFDGMDAFELPLGIAKGLDEEFFVGVGGGEIGKEMAVEGVVSCRVFAGQDGGVASEAVLGEEASSASGCGVLWKAERFAGGRGFARRKP